MRICLFEDQQVDFLEPLTLTRPAFHLRCGAYQLQERQEAYFGATATGALVRPHLAELCRLARPAMAINDTLSLRDGPTILVNGRWLPPAGVVSALEIPRVGLVGDQVAYAALGADQLADVSGQALTERLDGWKQTLPLSDAGGWMVDFPWDVVEHNAELLVLDFPKYRQKPGGNSSSGMMVVGSSDLVFVDATATIEPAVVADTTRGPVIIEREAHVQAFTRLEGPCYIGAGSLISGAKIRGSTIGPMCRVGGEVEASIMHGFSNKYHDGFLGHSYVGEWVNLAAGTQVSDLRNDYGPVSVTINGIRMDTHSTKVGTYFGDHSKTGLGTLLNTGSVVGVFCNLLPSGVLLPRVIPSFCRYSHGQIQARTDWREMLMTAAKVMQRRGQELTGAHSNLINAVFDQTAAQRRSILRDGDSRRWRHIT
jgi:UDP-N-acetylglucosamine diphosphorylase/glucosamine-1-phosphate N-acetyltransferase